jgi:hypothetical protein
MMSIGSLLELKFSSVGAIQRSSAGKQKDGDVLFDEALVKL